MLVDHIERHPLTEEWRSWQRKLGKRIGLRPPSLVVRYVSESSSFFESLEGRTTDGRRTDDGLGNWNCDRYVYLQNTTKWTWTSLIYQMLDPNIRRTEGPRRNISLYIRGEAPTFSPIYDSPEECCDASGYGFTDEAWEEWCGHFTGEKRSDDPGRAFRLSPA